MAHSGGSFFGIQAAAQGRTPVVLPYSKYVADMYGTVLLATSSVLSSNPDLVRRFAGALVRSIRYAVDNTAEAGTMTASVHTRGALTGLLGLVPDGAVI